MQPTVSVCMITYDHAAYIGPALDSILMQECSFEIELVVGEHESVDGTREICREYARRHPGVIRLIERSQTDSAADRYSNRSMYNFVETLKACRGKYIALCDGDDYWTDPLKLQKQVDLLDANLDVTGCFHDTLLRNEETGQEAPFIAYDRQAFGLQATINSVVLCHSSAFVFRREAVLPIPDWCGTVLSGDMMLFFLAACSGRILRIPEFMSVYRKHGTGVTANGQHGGRRLHYNRLKLFLVFRRHLGKRARELDWSGFDDHIQFIIGHEGMRRQMANWLRACREVPRLVLHPLLFRLFAKHALGCR